MLGSIEQDMSIGGKTTNASHTGKLSSPNNPSSLRIVDKKFRCQRPKPPEEQEEE
jgi:hypothetical protein